MTGRLDTSGVDLNLGSEMGSSPLSKRMNQGPHGTVKAMKNLKAGNFGRISKIQEEECSYEGGPTDGEIQDLYLAEEPLQVDSKQSFMEETKTIIEGQKS